MQSSLQNNSTDTKDTQRAFLNILDDYSVEKVNMENTQRSVLNILDDYSEEKYRAEETQRALLNILEDSATDRINMENTQRALLNILDDYSTEKANMENTQRAVLNILDDYADEKEKVENINQDLIVVNKELDAFTYSVSHDLRAPLRAVYGYAQILNEDYGTKLDTEGKRIIGTICKNAERMGVLIDELLAFSKLGRRELQKREIDMNVLTKGVLTELNKLMAHKAKINISKLHVVKADYSLIQQVMFNLISNAIKYSSMKEYSHIEIFSKEIKQDIVFSVKDNGAGFDMKYYDKLFGVFQRLHKQNEFEGIGVGLAIIQRIILKHGGKVWAEGKVGEGATFNFSLTIN
ncbi:MAG: hypothetical protein A3G23_06915 [Bacteroidetes bacterium RIFCSPLOWO2_12_FULL_37_12]|nr:MAG: hypothetical protein A3G23_06915 [Bacteroidetes bacterium RIFCSPLOWO2_12_FULL_37_12]